MISPQLPVGVPSQNYRPVAPTAVAPVQQQVAPVYGQQPVAAKSGGIMEMISGLFTGIINFFKKLFGGSGAANTVPGTVPTTPGATGLSGDDATIAKQFGIKADAANVASFKAILAAEKAEPGVIGPGSTDTASIRELQQIMITWGYNTVTLNGQFDPATADAVMRFKATNGLTENFVFDTGEAGVVPFIDQKTRAKMVQLLQTNTAPNPGLNHVPGVAAPPPPPPPPVAPPPPAPAPVAPPPPPAPLPTPGPVSPAPGVNNPGVASNNGLTAEENATAQQAGILATPANFKAFTAAAAALQAEAGAMGPGLNENPEAINELQQLLKQWGYALNQTGKFDNETVQAVMKFKKDNNISYGYQMADGTPGVHPFIDQKTKDVMIKKLGG